MLNKVRLQPIQNKILSTLEGHAGRIMSYEEMAGSIWGNDRPASWKCLLAIYVGHLRKKIPDVRQRLVTIQNIGYMWATNELPYAPIKKPNPKKIQVEGFRFASRRVDI